jgi:hypothetical protein
MARNRRKKALYEVIGQGHLKQEQSLAAGKSPSESPAQAKTEAETTGIPAVPAWPRKPRAVQLNAGRIEFSVPYQVAIAVLLIVALILLGAYRLGQRSGSGKDAAGSTVKTTAKQARTEPVQRASATVEPAPEQLTKASEHPAPKEGNNVIVLVEYDRDADLVPVQQHFRKHGIETEIVPAPNGRYYLWTKEHYKSVNTPGTPGYEAKQRIKEIGAKYVAPPNYETFAPHYFSDAYGKYVGEQ